MFADGFGARDCTSAAGSSFKEEIMALPITPILSATDDLVHRVATRLEQIGCHVRNFWISPYEDALILHGRVGTYYSKQLVQQVATEMSGRSIMSNEIEVD